jgi:GNAT superfamily N-acetyltransferase
MQRANAELAVLAVATAFSALLLVAARRRRRKPGESPSLATPPPPPDLSIIARQGTADELLSICRLRYMVYVGELKRSNYSYVDNIREILEDPLDHADGCVNLFVAHPENDANAWRDFLVRSSAQLSDVSASEAMQQQQAEPIADLFVPSVGCVRVHVPLPNKYAPLFSTTDASVWGEFAKTPHAFAFFSRFMVHSKFRGKSYGYTDLLYAAAAVEARRMGARFLLLNCTPALAVMYEARGWVRYKPAVWDEGMGLQVKHLLHALPCTHSYRP